jgi:hypothetical protein
MDLPPLKTIEEVADYLHLKRETLLKFCREKIIPLIAARPTFLLTDDDITRIIEERRTTKWCLNSSLQTAKGTKPISSVARSRKGDAFSRARELRNSAKQS